MGKERLLAFSDGVLAIIITIMVLELKVPHGSDWAILGKLLPVFLSYVMSFVYVGIYWNNHHHLMHAAGGVNGPILWANLHLLFWLSLLPFASGWLGENHFARQPTALYGFILLACALAYYVLQLTIMKSQGKDGTLARALGTDFKGKISPVLYIVGILISFFAPVVSNLIYAGVALMWLIPDSRIEKQLPHIEHRH